MSKEAMRLALEALEVATTPFARDRQEVLRAQAALREALAEQPAQQEPVATVVRRQYEDGTYAGNALDWAGRNCEDDFPVGTKLYTDPQPVKFNCTVVDDDHPNGVPLSQWGKQQKQKPFCYHDGRNIVGKEFAHHSDVFPLYTHPQAREPEQPAQQEPVAYIRDVIEGLNENGDPISVEAAELIAKLYFTPPQRKPLTDEQIDKLPWGPHEGNPMTFAEGLRDFARAIEAAHGIKENT